MDLSWSRNLATSPNFTGIPKLHVLDLKRCENLVEIHPSVAYLKWRTDLILYGCKSVKSLPREVEMDSLIYLSLWVCSKLKKNPEFSEQMENLSKLSLSGTAVKKLPSSIGRPVGLTSLDVRNCTNLLGLLSAICNLKSLKALYADGRFVEMMKVRRSQPNKSRFGLWSLKELDLSDSGLCDLPGDVGCLSSLERLNLSRSNFVSLPASIGCLSKLRSFWVNGCQRLQQLPHLRFGLVENDFYNIRIYTEDCTSLKMLPKSSIKNRRSYVVFELSCVNCIGLVENEGCDAILGMLWIGDSFRFSLCLSLFAIIINQ